MPLLLHHQRLIRYPLPICFILFFLNIAARKEGRTESRRRRASKERSDTQRGSNQECLQQHLANPVGLLFSMLLFSFFENFVLLWYILILDKITPRHAPRILFFLNSFSILSPVPRSLFLCTPHSILSQVFLNSFPSSHVSLFALPIYLTSMAFPFSFFPVCRLLVEAVRVRSFARYPRLCFEVAVGGVCVCVCVSGSR